MTGHRNCAKLGGMMKLAMTSGNTDNKPAIIMQHFNHIAYFHAIVSFITHIIPQAFLLWQQLFSQE